jgi:hypothetical protein
VASWLALAVAVAGVVTYAVQAEGYQAHKPELNDGGIWVTSNHDGSYGRINKPIGQLDGTLFSRIDSHLDVVQDGSSVVGVNLSDGVVLSIDPALMATPDGAEAPIPGSPAVEMAGGSLAVLDTSSGRLWAVREDPAVGVPQVSGLADQGDPLATAGADAALAVAVDGTVFAASSATGTLVTLHQSGVRGYARPHSARLPGDPFSDALSLTAVGATPVVLDSASGRLVVLGGTGDAGGSGDIEATVPEGSVLQQPGPSADAVLVSARDGLLSVDLATGKVSAIASGVGGNPARPVRLGSCVYGAWAGGTGAVVTACGAGRPSPQAPPQSLGTEATDLVFRTNRGQIVLNDPASGSVWDVDSDTPTRLDNWDAFNLRSRHHNDDQNDQHQQQGDRRPPRAKNDDLGARPGRTTILHPLDNDSAPSGRLLAIRSVRQAAGADATLAVSPDGQTVQVTLPPDAAGATSFEYFVDDGRQSVSAHATVRVAITPDGAANSEPQLRQGFEPRVWTVPATGTIDVPVLPDWRDPHDGDPVSAVTARAVSGPAAGADTRITQAGAVRFHAPDQGGLVKVQYAVTDGLGARVTAALDFRVQDPTDLTPVAPVAEPDVIAGETGKPITISPLANDLPGADPLTPDAVLTLAGKVASVPGAEVTTNLAKGTVTLRSDSAQTYFLDYQAAYGTADTSTGKIRVDVRAPERPPKAPVAVPDSVTLFGQTAALVDVLANDVDPSGGLLSVQRADPLTDNQLDVAVVEGRWLRISARQGQLRPNPQIVRYVISNGTLSGIPGQVVVSQRPPPADDTPVTQNDDVTVRSGTSQAIPVLDNDFSPAGGTLSLAADGGTGSGSAGGLDVQPVSGHPADVGAAFVAGRTVRYVAPAGLKAPLQVVIRYQAANDQGDTATGKVHVNVLPVRLRNDNPPEPPVLEGRTVSGDTITMRLPGYGVDPDGDAVTILGLDSAPTDGRVIRIGADSIQYAAYPGSTGTDEFTYRITDTLGATATGTVRVSIAPPGPPQPPLAVPDSFTVAPGRTAVVDVLANDLVAAGSRVSVALVDPPRGVRLRSDAGPVEVKAPARADGRSVQVVYRISDGLETSQATLTLHTQAGYNNPPVVSDAFGAAGDGSSVTVDVLNAATTAGGSGSTSGAYDPDGPADGLRVAQVYAAPGVATTINGGRITVQRTDQPMVVPFRVEDADGGAATGSLYVPAAAAGLPFVKPNAQITVRPGGSVTGRLGDYVVNPSGGPLAVTLKSRIWSSPATQVDAQITGDGTFRVSAARAYAGPGAVVFEVTTGASVVDPKGTKAVVSVPVQVGTTRPILRCPTDPIQVPQADSVRVDLAALCHVWTADPAQAADLTWSARFDPGSAGLVAGTPDNTGSLQVSAPASATPGDTGVLRISADGSDEGRLRFRVIATPPPSLAPIRVSSLKAGESQTIDLAPYLIPGVRNPVPTVVSAAQLTSLDVQISASGSSVTIRTGPKVHGHAEFRVVMSDVAGAAGPGRQVEGRIALDILGVPDVPGVPVPGHDVLDKAVSLDWRPPQANGAPIDHYEVRDTSGHLTRCRISSCDITGLTNGTAYRFAVRAHNAVGFSGWSALSRAATPDNPLDLVGQIKLVEAGDGFLTIDWKPVETKSGGEVRYLVSWKGGHAVADTSRFTATRLDNHNQYVFTITPQNALVIGHGLESDKFQPIGPTGTPDAPTLTDQETAGSQGAVSLTWPAVDPNGPPGVHYTVFRDGVALHACDGVVGRSCDDIGLAYDGHLYTYTVQATNDNGHGHPSSISAPTTWRAVGRPASWGSWDLQPTGVNNQAKATFVVPPSRGQDSVVRVYVDGARVQQLQTTGQAAATFDVPDNQGPHPVYLEVCNEKGACTQSSVKPVQTYGPFVPGDIHSVTPTVDVTRISWTIEVDSNGDPATVTVTSDQGRNETFQVPVGVSTVTTLPKELGYRQTENLTVTLSDPSPSRAPVSQTASATTAEPPPPVVAIDIGSPCNDSAGSTQPCHPSGGSLEDCTDPSCAFVVLDVENWLDPPTCHFEATATPVMGEVLLTAVPNGRQQTGAYYGNPGNLIRAVCDSTDGQAISPWLLWQ